MMMMEQSLQAVSTTNWQKIHQINNVKAYS